MKNVTNKNKVNVSADCFNRVFNIAYRENIGERYDKDKNYLFLLDKDAPFGQGSTLFGL
jgi:hypothetical protein